MGLSEKAKALSGDSAFPCPPTEESCGYFGMTLRQYIATAALQGLLANPDRGGKADTYARDAVALADAMMEELAR